MYQRGNEARNDNRRRRSGVLAVAFSEITITYGKSANNMCGCTHISNQRQRAALAASS